MIELAKPKCEVNPRDNKKVFARIPTATAPDRPLPQGRDFQRYGAKQEIGPVSDHCPSYNRRRRDKGRKAGS